MTEFNEESRTENRAAKKPVWKGFLSTVAAGVLGSALTLTAVPYFQEDTPQASVPEETGQAESSSNLDVKPVSSSSKSLADTIEQASKAIVGVVNMQQQNNNPFSQSSEASESGTGSGVIFKKTDDAAYIVTNNHVIENASEIQVTLHDGEKATAELIGTDALTDIAVLKIKGDVDAQAMAFGDSSKLRAGDQVLAIGNPLGLDLSRTVTQGIVSAVDRSIQVSTSAGEWNLNVIQTDAAINPGNSGGALMNTSGQLVGINSLKIADSGVEGLGFAIPSNEVKTLIDQLIENGQVVRPYLGVGLASFEEVPPQYLRNLPDGVTSGAIVANVDPDSAAAKAGLKVEDILVSIGGKQITNSGDLRKHLYSGFSIGDKVKIEFYRGGELKTAEVTLTSNQKAN
ncbi:trypsin-like peptidase domain-containing protein [Cytobacillus oceanisediminis]|uniref:S1C family serine protease n=1 Tax=Cytobacillus oceanisediminis TaxID=665099 RepID=UPI00203C34FA|nr:trypsin-like peptidase domain-containing protein [Cytobacillus oceanisediminis]MBY0156597.1 trypsin-like peptidase domain-containing protein [Cytobacillus firmus]MCM3531033.1 trypsin-like peptidase domain-containing protein [Cytobacillus oceanisediminis]